MGVPGSDCQAVEFLIAQAARPEHDGDPKTAARGCPAGHRSSLFLYSPQSLEADVLRVSCTASFFKTIGLTSSFCPLLSGAGFLVPRSKTTTKLPFASHPCPSTPKCCLVGRLLAGCLCCWVWVCG